MCDTLTSELSLKLQQTTQVFNRWADNRVDELESSDVAFQQTIEDSESTLDALKNNENNIESLRIRQNAIKERQQKEMAEIEKEIEQINLQRSKIDPEMKRLEEEEFMELQKQEKIKQRLDEIRAARSKSLNDLTKGIKMYKMLGLDFEKAENDCMRFIFTQIDSRDPSRKFEFLLLVDEDDCYQLVDSFPPLDPSTCKSFVIQLNEDNDISRFTVNMRREYQDFVEREKARSIRN